MSSSNSTEGAQPIFVAFVVELLTAEDKRREVLETRGSAVITTSGALVTLLLAFSALVTGDASFELSSAARQRLSFAVVAFVVAALLAIATHAPQSARVTDPVEFARLLPELWGRDADVALKKVTATRLQQLGSLQTANDRKAWALLGAVVAQVVAVLLLAWAVIDTL